MATKINPVIFHAGCIYFGYTAIIELENIARILGFEQQGSGISRIISTFEYAKKMGYKGELLVYKSLKQTQSAIRRILAESYFRRKNKEQMKIFQNEHEIVERDAQRMQTLTRTVFRARTPPSPEVIQRLATLPTEIWGIQRHRE